MKIRVLAAALAFLGLSSPALAQAPATVKLCVQAGTTCTPVTSVNPLPVNASVSVTGFPTIQTTGTPISVTTGGVTGTLPSGAVVVASNVGATNGAYCKLGASATTSDQLIPPNSWFAFTVGANTQLTCITSASTTTVNMVGGSGLPTGSGGGGGGSSSGTSNIIQTAGTAINAAIAATGALPVDIQTTSNLYAAATAPVPCKAGTVPTTQTAVTTGSTTAVQCDLNGNIYLNPTQVTALTPPSVFPLNATPTVANGNGVVPVAGTTNGASSYYVQPTASDNHANIKNGAGTAYSIHVSNNSATKNYLRLYDAGTAFNGCNSATGIIFGMEIPPNDSGFSISLGGAVGLLFSTGLSICVSSGYGSTDTTNATATAIMANVLYK
jgi:hypothetical protein